MSTISNVIVKCNSKEDHKQFYGGKKHKTTLKKDIFFRKLLKIDISN